MALTYLSLCNNVAANLGESQLTSSNFSNSYAVYDMIKNAVNNAIQDINHDVFEWPFQYSEATITTVTDQQIYDPPVDMKRIDWDTFYLQYNSTESIYAKPLEYVSYEEWHNFFRADDEFEKAVGNANTQRVPVRVFPTFDNRIGISPIPNSADHTISYNYWKTETLLSNHDDTTNIPEEFQNVIVLGAMYWVYKFRDNLESANETKSEFKSKLGNMRTLLINKFDRVRDTRFSNRYGW